jgi:hypothetical protein
MAFRNRSAVEAASPEVREAWHEIAESRRDLARLWARGSRNTRAQGYVAALAKAQQRKEEAESVVAGLSSELRVTGDRPTVRISEARDALPKGAGLAEIVRVQVVGQFGGRPWVDVALIVQPGGKLAFRLLGHAADNDARVAAWTRALSVSAPGAEKSFVDPASMPITTPRSMAAVEFPNTAQLPPYHVVGLCPS